MIVFSPHITPRLQYIVSFIGSVLGEEIFLTDDREKYIEEGEGEGEDQAQRSPQSNPQSNRQNNPQRSQQNNPQRSRQNNPQRNPQNNPQSGNPRGNARINYSHQRLLQNELLIIPVGLMHESTIQPQVIEMVTWQHADSTGDSLPAFFPSPGDVPFDLFGAAFYLLSRYEEYLPAKTDAYGRFAHTESIAFRESFLHRPLVNEWIRRLGAMLDSGSSSLSQQFRYLPTYDIDIAWSYLHKGFRRNAGGLLRSLMTGKFREARERISVLRGKQPDPFDSYEWLEQLHRSAGLHGSTALLHSTGPHPIYFFLLAAAPGRYDKNIHPQSDAMKQLISDHAQRYDTGIHPSWQSGQERAQISPVPTQLPAEIALLEEITKVKTQRSRQHYIRFKLPQTFRSLIALGIAEDYSMGYGSINGFRASVASPFFWFDLADNRQTSLQLFPFCYMDANSYYEQHLSADEALDEMRGYLQRVKDINGMMITIWHNHFLGTDPRFRGWKEVYEQFVLTINA